MDVQDSCGHDISPLNAIATIILLAGDELAAARCLYEFINILLR